MRGNSFQKGKMVGGGGGGTGTGEPPSSKHLVFVHGASHGGWCWYKVMSLLEEAGFMATSIDLTGAGISLTDSNSIFTFDHYNRPLFSFLSGLPPLDKVILVGHSIGGASVTEALCKFTHKISMAVYLAADMIRPGAAPSSVQSKCLGDPRNDEEEEIWEYMYGEGADQPPTGVIMKQQFLRHFYYSRSPFEDFTLASKLLRPAPYRALQGADKLPPTPEAEKVPRVFIKTAKDNLFDPSRQDVMVKMWPPSRLYVLEESDHSAFFSVPSAVFACLVQAVASIQP